MDEIEFKKIKAKVEEYETLKFKKEKLLTAIKVFENTKNDDKYSSIYIAVKGNAAPNSDFTTFIYSKNKVNLIESIISKYIDETDEITVQMELLK